MTCMCQNTPPPTHTHCISHTVLSDIHFHILCFFMFHYAVNMLSIRKSEYKTYQSKYKVNISLSPVADWPDWLVLSPCTVQPAHSSQVKQRWLLCRFPCFSLAFPSSVHLSSTSLSGCGPRPSFPLVKYFCLYLLFGTVQRCIPAQWLMGNMVSQTTQS